MDYTFEIIKYIGKFHPLVLHLPIGSLLMTFLLLLISKFQKVALDKAIRIGVDFSFVGALLSSVLGYFLSLDEAYEFGTLKFHFWAGVITLIFSLSLCVLHRIKGKEQLFFGGYVLTLIALSITGHQGAMITHGEEYLSTAELFETPPVMVQKDSLDYYSEVVHPIFEDKCISCHNANKSKSKLRMDRYDLLLKGGERGSLFDPNNITEGQLLKYINLPLEDKMHMPPKNKSQLTENEKWLLTYWVTSGFYLKKEESLSWAENDSLKTHVLSFMGLDEKIKPASKDDLAQLSTLGFRITPNALHDNLLKVKFLKKELTEKHLEILINVKNNLIELDLSHSNFNDEMAFVLQDLPRLKLLRLDQTQISDAALEEIKSSLEVLNLCNTQITPRGIRNLLDKTTIPETIYAWNTQINEEEQKQLASIVPSLIHFGSYELFSEQLKLSPPKLVNTNTLFTDSVRIAFEEPKVKNIRIHYTFDGSEPHESSPLYEGPFQLTSSSNLKAKSIKKGWTDSDIIDKMIFKNNHHVLDYKVNNELHHSFSISHHVNFTFEDNQSILFDGKKGENVYRGTSIEHGKTWLGVVEQDLEIEVQLKEPEKIRYVTLSLLENHDMKTIFPKKIEVYGKSEDGKYTLLKDMSIPVMHLPDERISYFKDFTLEVDLKDYSAVKILALNHMRFPDAPVYRKLIKKNSWIFIDELIFW